MALDRAAEQHAHRYGSLDQRLIHRWETRRVQALLRAVRPAPRTCLDAPCGYGRWAELLAGAFPLELLVGLDREPNRLTAYTEGGTRRAVQADLLGPLPFPDAAFDLVFSFRFLQHLRQPEERARVLGELRRVTRGHLLTSYYRAGGLHGLQRRLRPKRPGKVALAALSRPAFAQEAAAAGWQVVTDRPLLRGVHAQSIALLRVDAPPPAG